MALVKEVKPSKGAVFSFLRDTLRHSFRMEYMLDAFGFGEEDFQRPHDIFGKGNKFEWDVLKGLALCYDSVSKENLEKHSLNSLLIHRTQYHHKMWNYLSSNEKKDIPDKLNDGVLVGALDAVCSLIEVRAYQGGAHTYDQIKDIAEKKFYESKGAKLQGEAMLYILSRLGELNLDKVPDFNQISDANVLNGIPNLGLKQEVYDKIVFQRNKILSVLEDKGYMFSINDI